MSINVEDLVEKMLASAKTVIIGHWKEARPYAEQQFKSFGDCLQMIASLKAKDQIDEEQARLHIEIQKSSIRVVLLTIQGLGVLAVEAAINAAIDVIKSTVNSALGWSLL